MDAELHPAAYVEERTGSAALVGLLVFTQLGPLLVLSIPAGVLADRFPRRPYLIVMQAIQGIFSAVLAVLVGFDSPLWTLMACSLAIGIGNALNVRRSKPACRCSSTAATSPAST